MCPAAYLAHAYDAEGASTARFAPSIMTPSVRPTFSWYLWGFFPLFLLFPLFFDSAGLQISRHIVPVGYCEEQSDAAICLQKCRAGMVLFSPLRRIFMQSPNVGVREKLPHSDLRKEARDTLYPALRAQAVQWTRD